MWAGCIGIVQGVTGQVNTTLSFWLIVLVYVILGLLEVEAPPGDRGAAQ